MQIPTKVLDMDKVLRHVVSTTKLPKNKKYESVIEALVSSMVSQQLSVKAASTIFGRLKSTLSHKITAKRILNKSEDQLRAVGLSRQKASYIHNIAHFFDTKENRKRDWTQAEDQAIIDTLTQIKGVGVWTVQMLLIFQLERQDIFPVGDLGVQQKMITLYDLKGKKKEIMQNMEKIAENWSPFRSTASRYMWEYEIGKKNTELNG